MISKFDLLPPTFYVAVVLFKYCVQVYFLRVETEQQEAVNTARAFGIQVNQEWVNGLERRFV
jgi:hypothetical protein